MVSLLRTIQLDASDGILFSPAAQPGEWAVTGGFLFHGRPFDSLSRKERVAFRSGFLGVESFGFSTLAVVTFCSASEYEAATRQLAQSFVAHLGAPSLEAGLDAAREEIAFSAELCRNHTEGQLIALHREENADGTLSERFRALRPREGSVWDRPEMRGHERPFQFVLSDDAEVDHDETRAPDVGEEAFDLFGELRLTTDAAREGEGK